MENGTPETSAGLQVKPSMEQAGGATALSPIEKSVKIKSTVYEVSVGDNGVKAIETAYPLAGYGNYCGKAYVIIINYSKRWAKLAVRRFNNGYATSGHGMTESWTAFECYEEKAKARELFEAVKQKLQEAEDGTPEVKTVFDMVALYFKRARAR
jgi:hypothetical protein